MNCFFSHLLKQNTEFLLLLSKFWLRLHLVLFHTRCVIFFMVLNLLSQLFLVLHTVTLKSASIILLSGAPVDLFLPAAAYCLSFTMFSHLMCLLIHGVSSLMVHLIRYLKLVCRNHLNSRVILSSCKRNVSSDSSSLKFNSNFRYFSVQHDAKLVCSLCQLLFTSGSS